MDAPGPAAAEPSLSRRQRWYRGLTGHTVVEVPVTTPDGVGYLVRVRRASAVALPTSGDPYSMLAEAVRKNVDAKGRTGWDVSVVRPTTPWRAEREMFSQHVQAKAILVDVAMAIYDALERGDELWEST